MNIAKPSGESSCKGQENGDASNESERPLKKARFAWQVKGKYHLKNELNDSITSDTSSAEPEKAGSSSDNSNGATNSIDTGQNVAILSDYFIEKDFDSLDSVMKNTENTLHTPNKNKSSEKIPCPKYVSSYENINAFNATRKISRVRDYDEDLCIAKWQAKQLGKAIVDNALNHALESWMAPLSNGVDDSVFLALGVAEFMNNHPVYNSIENEGILMAISAHGLQNASGSNNDNKTENSRVTNIEDLQSPVRSLSPLLSQEENQPPDKSVPLNDNEDSISKDMAWEYSDHNTNLQYTDVIPSSNSPEQSSVFQDFNDNQHLNLEMESQDAGNNHYDFLDAAVSFAIQSKGLTVLGTEYG